MDGTVRASFVPERHPLYIPERSSLAKSTPFEVTQTVFLFYPILIGLNKLLELLTWSGNDPYFNMAFAAVLPLGILYWNAVGHFFLPVILALSVCCGIWFVKTTFIDYSSELDPPTLEEILDALGNVTVRVDFLCRPFRVFQRNRGSLSKTGLVAALAVPLNWLVVRFMGIQHYLVLQTFILLTYNSPWARATRTIIWRNKTVRRLAAFALGIEVSLTDKELDSMLLKYTVIKENGLGARIVQFSVYENQRRWLALGWSDNLLPLERAHYTNDEMVPCCQSLEEFTMPTLKGLGSSRLQWTDTTWKVDPDYSGGKDPEGWLYFDSYWQHPEPQDGLNRFTRSRRWVRRAILVSDKNTS